MQIVSGGIHYISLASTNKTAFVLIYSRYNRKWKDGVNGDMTQAPSHQRDVDT